MNPFSLQYCRYVLGREKPRESTPQEESRCEEDLDNPSPHHSSQFFVLILTAVRNANQSTLQIFIPRKKLKYLIFK